ncbi:MAG: hypothetical protein QF463_07195 [Vicinamibacterales bacterium]|nr:hypothetical protein [Vicinamibacterales bacterium]MDP6608834.1 hypothetical protein [Vicinamibacterales bacterium]
MPKGEPPYDVERIFRLGHVVLHDRTRDRGRDLSDLFLLLHDDDAWNQRMR